MIRVTPMSLRTSLLTVMCAWPTLASTPPHFLEFSSLDHVFDMTRSPAPVRLLALEILERVAIGQMDGASGDIETQVGLKQGQLRGSSYRDSSVRIYAIRKIGNVDLPEALNYLRGLTRQDLGPDTSEMTWANVQIAFREAQVNRIQDESAKIRFLEDTSGEKSAAASWAVDELCERGSYSSLGYIRESIRKRNPTADGEKQIAFCEARMAIISRDPDPVRAIGSFLTVKSGGTDSELIGWAINKLGSMKSAKAEAERQRYADEIENLPDGSPLKDVLWFKRVQIRGVMPARKK